MNLTDAPLFAPLSMQDASPTSRTLLEQAHRYFGFVPNLGTSAYKATVATRAPVDSN
jgi:hypothetical protein